jgi:hypothetical protein
MIRHPSTKQNPVRESRRTLALLILWSMAAGCGSDGSPDAEERGEAGEGVTQAGDRDPDGLPAGVAGDAWRLGGLELVGPVRTIEAFEDSADGYFADLILAQPLAGGRLLVVDRLLPAVLVMDESGGVTSRRGRRGQGPGELSEAASASASESEVWIIDLRNGWLQPFRVEADSLASLDPVRPPFLPETTGPGCLSDLGLWVAGVHSGRLFHAFDADGRPVRSMGDPFGGPDAPGVVAEFVSQGPMVCAPDGSFVAASYPLGVVRSYRPDGSLAWEVGLPDFTAMQVAANDRGGVTLTVPEGRGGRQLVEDLVLTLWAAEDLVGVQFGNATQLQGSWRDVVGVQTVLLDRESGEVLAQGEDLPRIDRLHGDLAISHGNSPLPGVRVYRWSWRSSTGG